MQQITYEQFLQMLLKEIGDQAFAELTENEKQELFYSYQWLSDPNRTKVKT